MWLMVLEVGRSKIGRHLVRAFLLPVTWWKGKGIYMGDRKTGPNSSFYEEPTQHDSLLL